jgi:hypothetical protein
VTSDHLSARSARQDGWSDFRSSFFSTGSVDDDQKSSIHPIEQNEQKDGTELVENAGRNAAGHSRER